MARGLDRDSTQRLVDLSRRVEVTLVLGAHTELDQTGHAYLPGSTHHPDERSPYLLPGSIDALSDALRDFNGLYAHQGDFVLVHVRNVGVAAIGGVALVVAVLFFGARSAWRHWRVGRAQT